MTLAFLIWIGALSATIANSNDFDYTQPRMVYGIPDGCKIEGDCSPRRYDANNIFIDPGIYK